MIAVSISQSSLGRFTPAYQPDGCLGDRSFNLAIEFGPVHAASGRARLLARQRFQSRNRVWAGSRQGERPMPKGTLMVPTTQSSLGRSTRGGRARGGRARCSFNLAIEFGPVHARSAAAPARCPGLFQSRNRVWAGSRSKAPLAALGPIAVSISQSSLGRFTQAMLGHTTLEMVSFNLAIEFGPVHARMTSYGCG